MVVATRRPAAEVQILLDVPAKAPGILVIDDEEPIRRLLQIVLQRQGFDVWLAADGRQAVKLYDRFRSQIDLVLLDVRMPGLDGSQTLEALRQLNPDLCCCFLTGHAGQYTEQQLRQRGAVRVFAKPFAVAELATALWKVALQSVRPDAELGGSADFFMREFNHDSVQHSL
jgi:CheY-like chemotaxis protein